jgi:hypothetical protein
MKMRKTPCAKGLLRKNTVQNSDIFIVSHFDNEKLLCSSHPTEFSQSSDNSSEITLLIKEQRLCDCLEYLDKIGCTGDTAIFMLACAQAGVAA